MIWLSYGIGIASALALIFALALVIKKHVRTASISVLYFTILIVAILCWVAGDMILLYVSQFHLENAAGFWSRFNIISSMVAMLATHVMKLG